VAFHQVGKNKRTTIVNTMGTGSLRGNIASILGGKVASALEPLELAVDGPVHCQISGYALLCPLFPSPRLR
jgi:hypothetical protein